MFTFAFAILVGLDAPPIQLAAGHHEPLPAGAITRFGSTRFGHIHPITWLGFANDKTLVTTGSHGHEIHFWDVATGNETKQYRGWFARKTFALSADGKKLALMNSQDGMKIVDTSTHKTVRLLTADELLLSFAKPSDNLPIGTIGYV